MKAADFLFELLCEELPPRTLLTLSNALQEGIVKGLEAKGVSHGAVQSFATPRRLAVRIEALAARQPDRPIEKRGPPLTAAYDAKGAPTQAAIAFARGLNVPVESLSKLTTDKGAWLHYRGTEQGAATATLLADIVNQSLSALPIAKRMRWGSRSAEFVRPVHGAVLLFGSEVVEAEILGLKTGRTTRGHRFHAPDPIELQQPREYAERLLSAKVMADFARRRETIRSQVREMAGGARALIEEALLEEVTALVEWPVAIQGRFDERFLALPREVVVATVQDHQRYFAIEGPDGKLSNRFVTVSNIESKDPSKVVEGNERVVRPRLSDAAFFFEQDKKLKLEEHAARLAGMTFQTKLGSYADKSRRIVALAAAIGARIGAGAHVGQAASLCKADLMTAMVGEFPELQGTMGRYYAQAEGLPTDVSRALEEHYQPRFAGDAVPSGAVSQAVALADKLDTLVGIFAIEQRPTGAKDPFGLRRAALGVLRILLEAKLDLDLKELLALSASGQPVKRASVVEEVYDYISERLRGLLAESAGASSDMLDAILAKRPASPLDATTRLSALKSFLELPEAPVLAALNKRISNILKKTEVKSAAVVAAIFTEEAERQLHEATLRLREPVERATAERRYADSLKALVTLSAPVNGFFDQVMVMDENLERRDNRLALLRDVQTLLGGVADLSKLPG